MDWTARPVDAPQLDRAARIAACAMPLESREAHAIQLLEGFAARRYDDDFLIGLFDDRDWLRGAAFWQPLPGRVAVVWQPQLSADWHLPDGEHKIEPQNDASIYMSAISAIFAEVNRHIRPHRVRVSQILLENDEETIVRQTLEGCSYQRLAELKYLIAERQIFPREDPAIELQFVPYTETDPAEFAALVERTYIGTLDCPLLDGVRAMDDVFESYRHGSDHDPEIWFRIQHQGEDIGVLIMTEYKSAGQMELIYMGVVQEHRGEGFGVLIAKYAQWVARTRSFAQLITAVDQSNGPAIKMYAIAGYNPWDRRVAYIHVFPND